MAAIAGKTQRNLTLEYSGNWPGNASRARGAAHNVHEAGAARHTLPLYVTASGKKAAGGRLCLHPRKL